MKYLSFKTNEKATRRREVYFLKGFFVMCSSEEGVDGEAAGVLASRDCPLLIMTALLPSPLVMRGQMDSKSQKRWRGHHRMVLTTA